MKIAAIDIGSNSVHMIIADTHPAAHSFQVVDREKEMVKLGARCFDCGRLSTEAAAAGLAALEKFATLIARHGCEEVVATATSAVREAANGAKFLREVARRTGIEVRVISGEEEARLIWLAVRSAIDLVSRRALIFDLGGGSIAALVGDARAMSFEQVMKLGVLRLRDRFAGRGPLGRRGRRAIEEHARTIAGPAIERARAVGFDLVVGTSGTILALAALARARAGRPLAERVSNETVALEDIERLVDWLVESRAAERAKLPGLDPNRVDTIHVGGVLLVELMRLAGAKSITLCGRALREGLVLDHLERENAGEVEPDPDIRRRSLLELVRWCETSGRLGPHSRHVTDLALALFDDLAPLHGLGAEERRLLGYAALVHDIGEHIAFAKHERHSAYLVRKAELRGFTRDEVELVAVVARYHRGAVPKRRHPEFERLAKHERRVVRTLAAILRVADGLDRTRFQVVRDARATIETKRIVLDLEVSDDAELEIHTARRKGRLFEKVFGRELEIRREAPAPPPARRARARPARLPARRRRVAPVRKR
jgi:exopolyphosphatase/guanosine-5'-triphosphate,3'-diphosphate pyrophosphatase